MEQPTLEKLICNESFINYCLQARLEDMEYWKQWVEANPQHRKVVEDAKGLVKLMQIGPSQAQITEERVRLQAFINKNGAPVHRLRNYRWIGYTAASLLLVSMGFLFLKRQLPIAENATQTELVSQQVPTGKYMNVLLSDSTKVKLGPTSTLRYPTHFNGDKRIVSLNGEGYFEVSHNIHKPFIIQTPDLEIKVLGTSFNVHAFENDELSKIALFTGKVEVSKGTKRLLLSPGQAIVYHKDKATFAVESFDLAKEKENMTGVLHFEKATFSEIAKQLNRKYGIIVQDRSDIELMYSGTIGHESLEMVLEKLSQTTDYRFSIESNTLIVRKK
ncbi:FecR domain-containing protein [Sphingobacterium paramultivorum]|jgi:ferric-dicitrate binding protein FerR (iron transport regulator)|uniref:FecR domain-containing protein n=1 Tax=Sphingobacterium paramultivorum TaxID=2886510 RepID=A0A7G5DWW3_9SPHI|nr:FecR family protein [Sphingobacterium paramultivorum]QMV66238.1 FecR domain-containing protein [Sphingobacterium paramultivorum]WSO15016.1 FecR domain-containing protein [Sphingobacterium paramultivorum]